MKRLTTIVLGVLTALAVPACDVAGDQDETEAEAPQPKTQEDLIEGRWAQRGQQGEMTFVPDSTGAIAGEGSMSVPGEETMTFRYTLQETPAGDRRMTMTVDAEEHPLALLRVEEDRMLWCYVTVYERTLNGIPTGQTSRIEWPESTNEPTCDVLRPVSEEKEDD